MTFKKEKTLRYKFMDTGKHKLSVYEKIKEIRSLISNHVGEISDKEIQGELCRCWYYNAKRRAEITPRQHEILDLLLKNGLNPKSSYHYFLLNNAPEHIKTRLNEKKISIKDAVSASSKWNKLTAQRGSEKLMEDIKSIIRRVEWKNNSQQ